MARRTGSADLPLHGGRVPAWLRQRMSTLGAVICQAIVHHYGRDEFLWRLSHPFWFQSFGAVIGMDWHSSGITTSVIGALKRGLAPLQGELGIHVCGVRGKHSRRNWRMAARPPPLPRAAQVYDETIRVLTVSPRCATPSSAARRCRRYGGSTIRRSVLSTRWRARHSTLSSRPSGLLPLPSTAIPSSAGRKISPMLTRRANADR
jgi:Protein of unknown function (DUF763)